LSDRAATLDLPGESLRRQGLAKVAELVLEGVMASAARLDSHDQQLLLDVGLGCWRGPLFGHLLDHASTRPNWVAIHHEQVCRYGAIWIHGRLKTDHSPLPAWVPDLRREWLAVSAEGIELINRPGGVTDWVRC
jgi:hypothetical protein